MNKFDDIRPYIDEEVNDVLHRLKTNKELLGSIIKFRYPALPLPLRRMLRPCLGLILKANTRGIKSVEDFQNKVKDLLDHAIDTTTDSLTSSGIEQLDLSKPHLFISNHRDIALDPAFVNYMLHINGQDTVQIAIGDNLLTRDWVSDVMRLNRSFIVKRSASSNREKFKQSKALSAYIHYALNELGDHIWIAQREGRAKDGIDKTNAALISMLAMNKDKATDFADYIGNLEIVPVSISYEYDPCDVDKATELSHIAQNGNYQKQQDEDIQSITKGIVGHKGRVHLHFSPPIPATCQDAKAVAEQLDTAIIGNYMLMATNREAYRLLSKDEQGSQPDCQAAAEYFKSKRQQLAPEVYQQLLQMYANPVIQAKALTTTSINTNQAR